MDSDLGWLVVAAVAACCGAGLLDRMRRERSLRPLDLIVACAAAYLALRQDSASLVADSSSVVTAALTFCALAPLLGACLWGWGGKLRRVLLRLLTAGAVTVGCFLLLLVSGAVDFDLAFRLSLCLGLVVLLPWRSLGRWWQSVRRRRRQRREKRHRRREEREQQALAGEVGERQRELFERLVEELRE